MTPLLLHEFHHRMKARSLELEGSEAVGDYGDTPAEHAALRRSAGVLDLSFRGRLCLTGADRVRFLHGQVTNDVKSLRPGTGCYAALVNAKGKLESDANIYCLEEELLLDLEPGRSESVRRRLEKYVVADDVQVVDAAPHYGLLSVQGPESEAVVRSLAFSSDPPSRPFQFARMTASAPGELYLMNQPRLGSSGFDLFVPTASVEAIAEKLLGSAERLGGRACGWEAFDIARVEAGIPRYGADMDESHFPLECGIEARAVSYSKGCYIGQEIINRIHTVGHVNRELRGLLLAPDIKILPGRGEPLFRDGKEAGHITSAVRSLVLGVPIALGYVRRDACPARTELTLRSAQSGDSIVTVVDLPFVK
jgi:folate-binding protein YgfZ